MNELGYEIYKASAECLINWKKAMLFYQKFHPQPGEWSARGNYIVAH